MNEAAVERIEQALGKELPDAYKAVLTSYPFGEDSFGFSCMLCNNADAIIAMNRGPSLHSMLHPKAVGSHPMKLGDYFWIGNDGSESEYFLNISSPLAPVVEFDVETGEIKEYGRDIHEYIEKIHEIDREIEQEGQKLEERRRNAKWWQFWLKL